MKTTLTAIAVLAVAGSLAGCCKAACADPNVFVRFEKFKATDTDTLVSVSYKKGSGFSQPVDTHYRFTQTLPTDTSASYVTEEIFPDYDWKLMLPSVNRQFVFTDFKLVKVKCCADRSEAVRSFSMNGVTYNDFSVSPNR